MRADNCTSSNEVDVCLWALLVLLLLCRWLEMILKESSLRVKKKTKKLKKNWRQQILKQNKGDKTATVRQRTDKWVHERMTDTSDEQLTDRISTNETEASERENECTNARTNERAHKRTNDRTDEYTIDAGSCPRLKASTWC